MTDHTDSTPADTTPAIEAAAKIWHRWSHGVCVPLDECTISKGRSAEGTTYAERIRARAIQTLRAGFDTDDLRTAVADQLLTETAVELISKPEHLSQDWARRVALVAVETIEERLFGTIQ